MKPSVFYILNVEAKSTLADTYRWKHVDRRHVNYKPRRGKRKCPGWLLVMSSAKLNNCDNDYNINVVGLIRAGSGPCCLGLHMSRCLRPLQTEWWKNDIQCACTRITKTFLHGHAAPVMPKTPFKNNIVHGAVFSCRPNTTHRSCLEYTTLLYAVGFLLNWSCCAVN